MKKTDRFMLIEEILMDKGMLFELKELYQNGDISDELMEVYTDSPESFPKLKNAFDGFSHEVKESFLIEIWNNHNDFKNISSIVEVYRQLETSSLFTEAKIKAILNLLSKENN